MRTILCPVDYSLRSDRLLQYIGGLGNDRKCKVYLISTQVVAKKELTWVGTKGTEYGRIDKMHDYVSGIHRIPCGIVHETLAGNFYKKLGEVADRYDIMATALSIDEKKANLDLQKLINETLVPILAIPDHFQYQKIKRLLYAYDYKHEPEPPMIQLHWLAEWFDAEVLFITLFPGDTSAREQDKLTMIQQAIRNSWKGRTSINFETIMYPNVPKGLEHYLALSQANDLLVLSINHQNILERVWHKSVVRGVLHYSKHPYLIIHQ